MLPQLAFTAAREFVILGKLASVRVKGVAVEGECHLAINITGVVGGESGFARETGVV